MRSIVSDMTFSKDGSKLYISTKSQYIYQYTLSIPWDIRTLIYNISL